MRTRIGPNWRVRQYALPVMPGCSVGSTVDQSVRPKGISVICMAASVPRQRPASKDHIMTMEGLVEDGPQAVPAIARSLSLQRQLIRLLMRSGSVTISTIRCLTM